MLIAMAFARRHKANGMRRFFGLSGALSVTVYSALSVRGTQAAQELDERYKRACATAAALISCGVQSGDAAMLVLNQPAMEGYINKILGDCALHRMNK